MSKSAYWLAVQGVMLGTNKNELPELICGICEEPILPGQKTISRIQVNTADKMKVIHTIHWDCGY